ncbi:hypothetical protein AOX55_0000714 [Sinorhizobium fredii CCBAU 25509]|nr:hypothetical protein AOX55_0000714 [Sinorhizobium fredii CCBAU 25509]
MNAVKVRLANEATRLAHGPMRCSRPRRRQSTFGGELTECGGLPVVELTHGEVSEGSL